LGGKNENASTPSRTARLHRNHQASHKRHTAAAFCWFVLAGGLALAQEPVKWKTGAELRQQLDQRVSIAWQQRGLRDGLSRVSQSFGVSIFLDRRIDPGQLLTLTVREVPLETLIKQAAHEAQSETSAIGAVTYVGPPTTASRLATLAAARRQDAAKLVGDAKVRLLRTEAWQWEELSEPRSLVTDLARRANILVVNADAIPHDLWPAASLPALPWTDRLTLLLAGFDLTFQLDNRGASVRLIPIPQSAAIEKQTPPRSTKLKKGGEKRYSLQVSNQPAGNVVRTVAETLGTELRYEAHVVEKLKQPVTFKVENVALGELMEAALKPVGLTYRLTEKELAIVEVR
jgi:hypothetical protein